MSTEPLAFERSHANTLAARLSEPRRFLQVVAGARQERFHLRTHRETRELPVFTLVPNQGGLKPPAPKEGVCVDSAADEAVEWIGGGTPFPVWLQSANGRCGSLILAMGRGGAAQIRGGKIAMPELVRMLSLVLGRIVRDQTGFATLFDVQLEFGADEMTSAAIPPPPPGREIAGVSIAQALQDQLGLRLQPATGPVEVIVIDRVERPTDN
jgi:uncharacterized protein (TIGR03435 family)